MLIMMRWPLLRPLHCAVLLATPQKQCTSSVQRAGSPEIDLGCFDIVYLAALVGTCSGHKREIMADVVKRMKPGALIVMRSAHSLRRLLYPVRQMPPLTM